MPFDPNKPYGTVHGVAGVSFDQGGVLYNFHHQRVSAEGIALEDVPKVKIEKVEKPDQPTKTVASVDTKEEMAELVPGLKVPADMLKDPEPPDDFMVGDVNLSAYARGEEKYPWFKLRAAVNERFDKAVDSKEDLMTVLVEEGIAPKPEPTGDD